MVRRRKFLVEMCAAGLALALPSRPNDAFKMDRRHLLHSIDVDWEAIRTDFLPVQHELVNLNSGSSGTMPIPVLERYMECTRLVNSFAPYHVLGTWKDVNIENLDRLSKLVDAQDGHIAFVRNTTEAVNIILSGIDWKEGDEIITANWDYPHVEYTVDQLARKYGVRIRNIDHDLPGLSNEEIIALYDEQLNERTRLAVITWMTHREGQILPAREITRLAHSKGAEVMIDGAHIVGQMDISLADTGADYFASSLHKWLNAPLGSGMLYIRNEQMPEHFPYLSFEPSKITSADKYNYLGTRAFQNLATLGAALDYLELTGIKPKQERLHALTQYWTKAVNGLDRVSVLTDIDHSIAVACMHIEGLPSGKIQKILKDTFKIHVKKSAISGVPTIRISPNIYTSFNELDRLIEGVEYIVKNH